MTTQERLYTAADLWQFSQENPEKITELHEGLIIEMSPSSAIPGMIAAALAHRLYAYVQANTLGYVTTAEGGYELYSTRA